MAKEWWESYAPADEPKEDWWSQYSVEAEKPQGRRDVTPFKVDIQQPAPVAAKPAAARPVTSAPSEDYTDAMGSDFGSAIMAAAEPKRASVLEGVTLPPQAPLIERRGAPVSEEKFKELKQKYEAATPKERAALMQAPGFESSVLQAIDTQYQAAPGFGDARRETRRSAYIAQGAAPELADQLAARDAAAGIETERLAAIKPSDFDFANRAEYKRPEGKLALEETGGLLGARMIQPTGFDQLVGAGKAIGGKVSGTFQSAAAGAWQFLGDTAEVAGDLVGSTQLADVGARLSSGNALQQKAAKAKLEAIGENPNAALNFIETGVAGAINNFAPYLVNPGLGMTAAVAQTFADEYGTGKAAGQTMSQALPRAGMMAAAEWIGEHASLPTPLMKGFKELVKGVPANEVMPQFARYLVKENAAEQVTTAMNFGTDKWAPFGLTPDATLKDYLSAVGDTFYQTTAQTLVMGGAGRVAAPIARKLQDLTTNPNSAFAEAFAGDVAGAQFDPAAIDAYARRALDVQAYDTSIIAPRQQAQVQQDQADLQSSTSAGDAATAADNLSGSLAELLVPRDAVTPLPIRIEPTLAEGKPLEMPGLPDELARIEPTMAQGLPLEAQGLPEVNPAIEQQFGLDKLRINAPRPQKIQGEPVANLTDDRLTSIVEDEGVHPMTRRGAAIELTARQAEQAPQAFAQQPAPQQTATPSTVAFAPASATPENLPSGVSFAPAAPAAPVAESRTYTPAELGSMTLGERRTLSRTFDQTENEDGTTTFTAKPGVAPAPSAAPAATTETNFGLGAAEGRVSDAPVAATGDAARAELQTRLNQAAAQHGVEVPTLAAPAKSDEATVTAIGKALGATGPVVAYADPNGADGFQLGGAIAINTKTQKGVAATAFHENHHIAEQIAAADTQAGRADTPAQQYVASVNGLFDDMSDEGKRSYAVNFLHKDELASIADPVAREQRTQQLLSGQTLRSEMVADFMGNRATDRPFLADLAKADPKGFGGFVQKWIGILDNMLVRLRGVKDKSNLESVKVDQYIKDINRAKMVARDAMVAFRNGTLQQSATATTPLAFSQQQGELNAPSIGTAGSQILPGASASDRRGVDEYGGNPPPSYGTPRTGAISVVGRHYSATPRQTLSGEYYGRGLKGAERTRLDSSPDPRLKNRVYFYVDQGKGIRPEAGVGGYAHETKLDNIYDPQTRLIKPQVDANAFESAVINAGFDGYIAPFGNGQSAVVLLGQKHKAVPVRAIGQPQAAALPAEAAPTTLKKGLMSKELSQIDTSNIPGARVRAGTLEIPAEQQDAANAELARIGSTVRFAKKEVAKPARVMFEVAPDPNNTELKARWDAVPFERKVQISQRVAEQVMPQVFKLAGVRAKISTQLGGYLDDTSPSFAAIVPSSASAQQLMDVARVGGFGLAQDSMMVLDSKPFEGSFPTGLITVTLPENMQDQESVHSIYQAVRKVSPENISGHTTVGKEMVLAVPADKMADLTSKIVGVLNARPETFGVDSAEGHMAFPSKEEYDYGQQTGKLPPELSAKRAEANRIREEASAAIESELATDESAGGRQIDTGVYRSVADAMGLSQAEYNASALPLMLGGTGDKTFRAPNIGGVPEVVQWLDQRRAASGLAKLDINKPADRTILAKLLASEAVAAIRSAGNAVEWYDETVAKTLRIMAVKYPELNTDQNARNAFLMAVAISSQTMNVEDNLRYASGQYEAFRETGKFPEVGTGKSAPAMGDNFKLANKLLADFGPEKTRQFLQTEFTKRELEMSGYSIGGESMDEKMLGSAVFGPKIGFGFYSNLTGNFEPVTMDMWFMRTVGRLAGTLPAFDPVLFPKQVAKLRAALAETGPAERGVYAAQFSKELIDAAKKTDEGAIALAREINALHNRQFIKERAAFDSGARIKTTLVGVSGAILKSADKPTDSPASGGERQRLRDVVRQMVAMVEKETGKRVPPAALQALIWYPEQELYKKLGVRLRVTSQDYAGAAKSLLTKEGFDGKRISTAAKSGPGPSRQVAGQPDSGKNGPNGGPVEGLVPLQGEERESFIRERAAKIAADAVKAQSLESIFGGLDKRGLARTRAEAAFTARPDGAQIKYVQENFHDILIKLEDADKVKINCD